VKFAKKQTVLKNP